MFQLNFNVFDQVKSKSNYKTGNGALLKYTTLSYFMLLESTHLELSNDTKNKYVDLINMFLTKLNQRVIIKRAMVLC